MNINFSRSSWHDTTNKNHFYLFKASASLLLIKNQEKVNFSPFNMQIWSPETFWTLKSYSTSTQHTFISCFYVTRYWNAHGSKNFGLVRDNLVTLHCVEFTQALELCLLSFKFVKFKQIRVHNIHFCRRQVHLDFDVVYYFCAFENKVV